MSQRKLPQGYDRDQNITKSKNQVKKNERDGGKTEAEDKNCERENKMMNLLNGEKETERKIEKNEGIKDEEREREEVKDKKKAKKV